MFDPAARVHQAYSARSRIQTALRQSMPQDAHC